MDLDKTIKFVKLIESYEDSDSSGYVIFYAEGKKYAFYCAFPEIAVGWLKREGIEARLLED